MMTLYSLLLFTTLLVSSPWWLLRMLTTDRYREGLTQRLGLIPRALLDYIKGHRILWLHVVSVGELLAASRLIPELEAELNKEGDHRYRIVISTTTKTGQHLARERFGAERVFYMPLDFAFTTRRYLRALNPTALILTESELWPRLLYECNARNTPVIVINARMSDRSFARAQKFRHLWTTMARRVTLFLAQSEQDANRISTLLNTPTSPNPVILSEAKDPLSSTPPQTPGTSVLTTGNLKYDIRAPKRSQVAELIKRVANGRPILVAGSTTGDADSREESWLITVWGEQIRNELDALLVLAPRHPQRFQEVWKEAIEFPAIKITSLIEDANTQPAYEFNQPKVHGRAEIILLDTVGDLASVYGVADVAFLGGSLLKRGGHNPLEAARFGVPVIMGPSFENFRDVVTKMQAVNGIVITAGEAEGTKEPRVGPAQIEMRDSLSKHLFHLLANPTEARALGERGRAVYESQQGATARTITAILSILPEAHP